MTALTLSPALAAGLRDAPWHYVVTGANGWLGRATLAVLRHALGDECTARVTALGSRPGTVALDDGFQLPVAPLLGWTPPPGVRLCVCHYAFLTMDKVQGMDSAAYVAANEAIRAAVLGWIERGAVAAALVPSSGAVYDYLRGVADPALAAARPPAAVLYGRLKVEDEQAFAAACARHGVPLVLPRVFNLAGPGINKYGAYALASFIDQLQAGGDIAINARRPVLRSYYYIGDLLELCLGLLLRGGLPAPHTFDTAADETVELEALARRVAAVLSSSAGPRRAPLDPDAQADRYVGDRQAIAALEQALGVRPLDLDAQIAATAAYMKRITSSKQGQT
jgi:nucleoside-diphosphate-sugar epimerase